jgi:Pre-toxin TG
MRRSVSLLVLGVGFGVVFAPGTAYADNCADLLDCYRTAQAGLAALVGLSVLSGVLLSMGLDFVPGVGTIKGIIEAITGRDIITGQELAEWERVLGIVPLAGPVAGSAVAGAKKAEAAADLARDAEKLGDAAEAAKAARGMSTGEAAEAAALRQSRPNATLLGEKAGGYDATQGGEKVINYEVKTTDKSGNPIVVRDVTLRAPDDAIQIKTITQLDKYGRPSAKPLPQLVADNVRAAMKKAYNQPVTRARARTPLPGTNIYERTNVEAPKKITIIVQVPGEVTQEMRDAASHVVKTDTMAAELPPIDVVVQTAR